MHSKSSCKLWGSFSHPFVRIIHFHLNPYISHAARLEWRQWVLVSSTLETPDIQDSVLISAAKIGARIDRYWSDDATHLIMVEVKVRITQ